MSYSLKIHVAEWNRFKTSHTGSFLFETIAILSEAVTIKYKKQ